MKEENKTHLQYHRHNSAPSQAQQKYDTIVHSIHLAPLH